MSRISSRVVIKSVAKSSLSQYSRGVVFATFGGVKAEGYKSGDGRNNYTNAKIGLGALAGGVAIVGGVRYYMDPKEVYGSPIRSENGTSPDWVKTESDIVTVGKKPCGKEPGSKVTMTGSNGETQYYYRKTPPNKEELLNELVSAELGVALLGVERSPAMYLIESDKKKGDKVRYDVLSQSLAKEGSVTHDLEEWRKAYDKDGEEIKIRPNNIGVAIAFGAIIGDSDNKLGNVVTTDARDEPGYNIDNGYAFKKKAQFSLIAEQILSNVNEYSKDKVAGAFDKIGAEDFGNADVSENSLKSILENAKPVLLRGVQDDIDNGAVAELYHKFATLPEQTLINIVDKFSSLMTQKEVDLYKSELLTRQKECQEFVQQNKFTIQQHLRKAVNVEKIKNEAACLC